MPTDVEASLAAAHAEVEALLAYDPRGASAELQIVRLDSLVQLRAKLDALDAGWLATAHDDDVTVEVCGRATRSWLVEEQRLNPGEAARRMRLAKGLPDTAETFAALTAGEIHAEHALVIMGVLPHVADEELRVTVERALVEQAREDPPFLVARSVDEVLTLLGAESSAAAAHERRYGRRGVGVDETFGGAGSLNGTLTPEVREKLRLALDAAGAPAGPADDRSQRQRFHDGLGEVCDFYLAHSEGLSPVAGERPRVVVTMSYEMLCHRLAALDDQWATLGSGMPIAPETARRLACDAEILPVVLNAHSEVLDLGRSSRLFSTAIRRAAWLAQGGRCAFPRCQRRPVDCHHIIWWSNGGPSSLDNASWLCAFHHWLAHEGGWTMRRDPDGGLTFQSCDGRHQSTGPPRQPQAA